jgi:hypothetical protein
MRSGISTNEQSRRLAVLLFSCQGTRPRRPPISASPLLICLSGNAYDVVNSPKKISPSDGTLVCSTLVLILVQYWTLRHRQVRMGDETRPSTLMDDASNGGHSPFSQQKKRAARSAFCTETRRIHQPRALSGNPSPKIDAGKASLSKISPFSVNLRALFIDYYAFCTLHRVIPLRDPAQ